MSSYPSDSPVSSTTRSNGHAGATRTVDWTGYPTLFRRETNRGRQTTVHAEPEPMRTTRPGRNICEAFLGYCQAMLLTAETAGRFDRPSERSAAAQALAAAKAFGFTSEEIRRIGCGLYPSAAAVREHLRDVGFSDAEIDAANLVCDGTGRPRAELTGNMIVPLADEQGRTRDYLMVAVDPRQSAFASYRYLFGTATDDIVAHGLQTALSRPAARDSLLLVDDVLDGLLLQCRGVHGVVAIGGRGRDFTPRRWEELSRLGITSVTLALRRDGRHALNVRDALVNALRARTAPEIYVADAYPAGEDSPLDVLRRFGRETYATAIANRTLAFHDKDFGAAERESREVETPDEPRAVEEPYYRIAFRQRLAELIAALPTEDRPAYTGRVAAMDEAIQREDWERVSRLVDDVESWQWFTWSTVDRPAARKPFADAAMVLERLGEEIRESTWSRPAAGGDRLDAVEWLVHESAERRLEMLCERILDACEDGSDRRLFVACHEHSDEQIMLALTTQLAGRLSSGPRPTTEEVRRRLAGSTHRVGEQPWVIDEAVDRLRCWSRRLEFIDCRNGRDSWTILERSPEDLENPTNGTVLFLDGVPAMTWRFQTDSEQADWLRTASRRFARTTVATSAWPRRDRREILPELPTSETEIRRVLRDWEQRELEALRE